MLLLLDFSFKTNLTILVLKLHCQNGKGYQWKLKPVDTGLALSPDSSLKFANNFLKDGFSIN